MKPKGIVFKTESGKYCCKIKTSLLSPYKVVKDKYGNVMLLRFKQSAIMYLVNNCNVQTKNIEVY